MKNFAAVSHSRQFPVSHRRRTQRRFRRGIALVWTALILIVMIGFVGYGIDVGKVCWNVNQMWSAADSGALAGAQVVKYNPGLAITRAHDFAYENEADQRLVNPSMAAQGDPLRGDEEIILGRWVRQEQKFYPTIFGANAVKVIAKRQQALGDRAPALSLLFGPMFGTDSVDMERYTIGWSRVSSGAGIICLADNPRDTTNPLTGETTDYKDYGWNNGTTGFLINGGCNLDLSWTDPATGEIIYGDIQVNAVSMETNPKAALSKTGTSGDIICGEINVVGWSNPEPTEEAWETYYGEAGLPFSVNASPVTDRMEDPLLQLNVTDAPNIGTMGTPSLDGVNPYTDTITGTTIETYGVADPVTGEKVLTLTPGWYPGGIDMSSGNIVLTGGVDAVYAFGGADDGKSGLVTNGGSIVGDGVMIYITGDPDGSKTGVSTSYGQIDIGGNAHCELTSRGDAGLLGSVEGTAGMILWQDIYNHNQATIIGTADSFLNGTLYFPDNPAQVGGGTDQLGAQIICGALQINGNIDLGIAYDGRNMITAQISVIAE